MNYSDVKSFLQTIATAQNWGFSHNSEHLENKINSERSWEGKYILVMDEPTGSFTHHNDSFLDMGSYGFWLLKTVKNGDWENEDSYYQQAKDHLMDYVMAPIYEQMENEEGLWQHFEGQLNYRKAGPLSKQRLFGIYVTLAVRDTMTPGEGVALIELESYEITNNNQVASAADLETVTVTVSDPAGTYEFVPSKTNGLPEGATLAATSKSSFAVSFDETLTPGNYQIQIIIKGVGSTVGYDVVTINLTVLESETSQYFDDTYFDTTYFQF